MFRIKLDDSDIKRIAKWVVNDLYDTIDDHQKWGVAAIHIAGISINSNFNTEGGTFGASWQHLSEFTKQKRTERGYPPEHPILVQSGELKRLTAGTLMGWREGAVGYEKKDKDGRNMSRSGWEGRNFYLTLTGPKAQNQYGGGGFAGGFAGIGGVSPEGSGPSRYGAGFLPARPFLHLRPEDVPLMTERTVASFMGYWQRKGKGVKRTHGRMMVLPMGARKKW